MRAGAGLEVPPWKVLDGMAKASRSHLVSDSVLNASIWKGSERFVVMKRTRNMRRIDGGDQNGLN